MQWNVVNGTFSCKAVYTNINTVTHRSTTKLFTPSITKLPTTTLMQQIFQNWHNFNMRDAVNANDVRRDYIPKMCGASGG